MGLEMQTRLDSQAPGMFFNITLFFFSIITIYNRLHRGVQTGYKTTNGHHQWMVMTHHHSLPPTRRQGETTTREQEERGTVEGTRRHGPKRHRSVSFVSQVDSPPLITTNARAGGDDHEGMGGTTRRRLADLSFGRIYNLLRLYSILNIIFLSM
jgi:hypothetical protein